MSLSHLLAFVLKRFKAITTAVLIGFIAGSLIVVWPWKQAVYRGISETETLTQHSEILRYTNYWPDFTEIQNQVSLGYIALGIGIVLAIDMYGRYRRK